jgi:membrane-associated protein
MNFIDLLLHLNKYLDQLVLAYPTWIYGILFLIIFCETGLVITPFLPGDALLFTVGSLTTASGSLNLPLILILLTAAAILGDSLNYWIGARLGERLYRNPESRIFNPKHLEKTHAFYEKYGTKTIILARFLPLIRTFAPFVAGMGAMNYRKFATYNVIGAVVWVLSVVLAGHFFGQLPSVQKNFSIVVLAIILISMVPPSIEVFKAWREGRTH